MRTVQKVENMARMGEKQRIRTDFRRRNSLVEYLEGE
jgi:hypothetical protein